MGFVTGFFDDFTTILLAVVALVVAVALFERSVIVWKAKKKRERQDRSYRKDVEP
jgi:mannose/fructose/N-acetylgalactosamine-specific phosphotransferase system component IIC